MSKLKEELSYEAIFDDDLRISCESQLRLEEFLQVFDKEPVLEQKRRRFVTEWEKFDE